MRKKTLGFCWLLAVLLFMYAPILLLSFYSFTDATMIGSFRQFTFQNFVTLFTTEELQSMIIGTLLLVLVVSVLATILGTLGAIGSFYGKYGYHRSMDLMNQVPVVNADVVTGFSVCVLMIVVFGVPKDTYLPMIVGLTSLCAPFVYLSVMPRLKQMDPQIFEAALDLGCTQRQALRKVVLPQIIPGILSGFMMSVTLVLDDYFICTYTKPSTFDTISTYVVNATKGARTEIKTALWALSTCIFIIVIIGVCLMNLPKKKEQKYDEKRL